MAAGNKAANLWVSRVIPTVLVGIVGYVTWVVVVLVCCEPQPPMPLCTNIDT